MQWPSGAEVLVFKPSTEYELQMQRTIIIYLTRPEGPPYLREIRAVFCWAKATPRDYARGLVKRGETELWLRQRRTIRRSRIRIVVLIIHRLLHRSGLLRS